MKRASYLPVRSTVSASRSHSEELELLSASQLPAADGAAESRVGNRAASRVELVAKRLGRARSLAARLERVVEHVVRDAVAHGGSRGDIEAPVDPQIHAALPVLQLRIGEVREAAR